MTSFRRDKISGRRIWHSKWYHGLFVLVGIIIFMVGIRFSGNGINNQAISSGMLFIENIEILNIPKNNKSIMYHCFTIEQRIPESQRLSAQKCESGLNRGKRIATICSKQYISSLSMPIKRTIQDSKQTINFISSIDSHTGNIENESGGRFTSIKNLFIATDSFFSGKGKILYSVADISTNVFLGKILLKFRRIFSNMGLINCFIPQQESSNSKKEVYDNESNSNSIPASELAVLLYQFRVHGFGDVPFCI